MARLEELRTQIDDLLTAYHGDERHASYHVYKDEEPLLYICSVHDAITGEKRNGFRGEWEEVRQWLPYYCRISTNWEVM